MIFDLRLNGGGSIEESTAILDYFVTSVPIGTTLCRMVGQQIDEEYGGVKGKRELKVKSFYANL